MPTLSSIYTSFLFYVFNKKKKRKQENSCQTELKMLLEFILFPHKKGKGGGGGGLVVLSSVHIKSL